MSAPASSAPGKSVTYEFEAEPFGLHLYHCHVTPLAEHIARGMYGAFVIDPRQERPEADEMVMVMNGFDTNFDLSNEVYAVNTVGFAYMNEPIRVRRNELVRIYLVNVLEFDPINSMHIHANFFHYYPTGTSLEPVEYTDTIMQCQGQRGILELRFPYEGQYMFHAHQSEFAQLGWMGLFDVVCLMEARADVSTPGRTGRVPAWVLGAVPLALIALALATFALLDGPGLTDRTGPPVEELAVERTVLEPGRIDLTVRNDGPDDVTLAQVIVNDGFADFSATDSKLGHLDTSKVSIRYHWVEGDAYEVQLLTSTGATIAHEIPVAVETPDTDLGFYGLMALLGLYVGIVPVTLGMLWLPFVRRIDPRWLRVLMALTVGLLAFLAIDATLEGIDVSGQGSQALGGASLVFLGGLTSYLVLSGVEAWLQGRREKSSSARAGRMSRCWSRSRSASTTWARDLRSARRTRSGRWRWVRSW